MSGVLIATLIYASIILGDNKMKKHFNLVSLSSFLIFILVILSQQVTAQTQSVLNDSLFEAANNGNLSKVSEWIAKGADVNAKNKVGSTAIIGASGNGSIEIVSELILNGADVNTKDGTGWTALIISSNSGHTEIVRKLIANGGDVNAKNNYGATSLMRATENGHIEIVKILIKNNADLDAKGKQGETALMISSLLGHTEIVKLLIESGADITIKDNYGSTALQYASNKNLDEIVRMINDQIQSNQQIIDKDSRSISERINDPSWDKGKVPMGCFYQCSLKEGCYVSDTVTVKYSGERYRKRFSKGTKVVVATNRKMTLTVPLSESAGWIRVCE